MDLLTHALHAAAAQFEAPPRRFATPGELAAHIDPRTIQTPALDLIDAELVRLMDTPGGRLIISMPPQQGKALALDTPVPTPTGWSTMGTLRVGDWVIGGDGRPCRVTWVSSIWTGRDCYAVTTGDGERIVADGAHEWVARLDRRSAARVVDTVTLANPRAKSAQITAPAYGLELPDADLPLDPYVLGVWLGDGNSSGPIITCHPDDLAIRERFAEAGWPLKHQGKFRWSMIPVGWINRGARHPSPAKVALRATGALGNKHIPMAYLRASRAQRLALLQGLVDSDGYVAPDGQVEFCATRRVLAEGVRELVYSLGGKAVMSEGRATIAGRDCGTKYRVRFYLANAAHLPRKADRCRDSSVASVRYVKAEPCASAHTVCIEVDSPDHMFLAGRTMLPTHNSTRAAQVFPVWALQQRPDRPVIVASYGEQLAERNGETIRDLIRWNAHTLGIDVERGSSAKKRWKLEGRSGGVLSAGIGSGMTGWASGLTIIDDPIKDQSEADSGTYRDRVWNWWLSVAQTRLAPGAPVVVILTRWHTDDLAGRLLAAEDGHRWRVVNIPAQADHDPAKGESDLLGRDPGEYLRTARRIPDATTGAERPMTSAETAAYWEAIKVGVGSRVWNALYQGRPTPGEGGTFKREWLTEHQYTEPVWVERSDGTRITTNPGDELLISADFAFKDTAASDYIAIGVWLRRGPDVYLLDLIHGRRDYLASCHELRTMAARWPQATLKLVEDKANGTAIIRSLRRMIPGLVPEEPKGGKTERANAVTPFFEAGNVHLPSPELAPWVGDYIEEFAAFPNGKHDDQCLVGETTVTTPHGEVRLDSVQAGDVVLGASGWVDVLAAGQTGNAPVVERAGIVGTAAHPVWSESRGWVQLSRIDWYDELWISAPNAASEPFTSKARAGAFRATSAGGNFPSRAPQHRPRRGQNGPLGTVTNAALKSPRAARVASAIHAGWRAMESALKLWSTRESSSAGTPTPTAPRTASTTSPAAGTSRGASTLSTARSTRTTTAPSLMATTSTTSTLTRRTTTLQTLWRYLRASTSKSLLLDGKPGAGRGGIVRRCLRTSMRFALKRRHGIVLREVGSGTARTHAGTFPVYNLTTSDGTYFANGVLTHNCDMTTQAINRLLLQPLLAGESLTDDVFDEYDERGYVYTPY